MKAGHRKTLCAIFARPAGGNIKWRSIEALFKALGADVEEREGSRIAVIFPDSAPDIFHRPHPSPDTSKTAVTEVRKMLARRGFKP